MITVGTNYTNAAIEKIRAQKKDVKDRKAAVMKSEIAAALINFAKQDNEFAQAIVEGGSFPECMAEVEKGICFSISDIDAIRKAVQFYFKGAEVTFSMAIHVNPHEVPKTKETGTAAAPKKSVLDFSIDDLF
ncbi:MAG: hypothetical protein ACI4Q6_02830 [Huintestinicola sp.]